MTHPRMRTGKIGDAEPDDMDRRHAANVMSDAAFVALALAEPAPPAEPRSSGASCLAPSMIFVALDLRNTPILPKPNRQGERGPKDGETEWTPDRVERLTAMWAAGRRQDDIAAEFALSRGAISGKAARLGLSRRKPERRGPLELGPKTVSVSRRTRPALPEGRVTFGELTRTACHFPVGEGPFLFCGEPAVRAPYCTNCASIAYC